MREFRPLAKLTFAGLAFSAVLGIAGVTVSSEPAGAVVYCTYVGYPHGRVAKPGVLLHPRPVAADFWGLTEQQRLLVLGYPYHSKYLSWCRQALSQRQLTLSVDVLMRISAGARALHRRQRDYPGYLAIG